MGSISPHVVLRAGRNSHASEKRLQERTQLSIGGLIVAVDEIVDRLPVVSCRYRKTVAVEVGLKRTYLRSGLRWKGHRGN